MGYVFSGFIGLFMAGYGILLNPNAGVTAAAGTFLIVVMFYEGGRLDKLQRELMEKDSDHE